MEPRYGGMVAAPRFFLDAENTGVDDDAVRHRRRHLLFLDACSFLCKRHIGFDRHLFMYKGDAAFCSDGCRQEQVDMDAAQLAGVPRDDDATARSSGRRPRRRRRPPRADLTSRASVVSG